MVAGKRPFDRASKAETMTAIIREEAEPLPGSVPTPLRWIIERLLSKEATERYDSTRDLYREMRQIREGLTLTRVSAVEEPSPIGKRALRRVPVMLGVGAACLAMGGALTLLLIPPPPDDVSAYKFTPLSREEAMEVQPQWSPDGKSIAYTTHIRGIAQVFTKSIGEHDAAQITKSSESCNLPFWSSSGSAIYYTTLSGLWEVGASGGVPELVLEKVTSASTHPDGKTLAFVRDGGLFIGQTKQDPNQFGRTILGTLLPGSWVKFSPDGTKLAVYALKDGAAPGDLWLLTYPSGVMRKLQSQIQMGNAGSWFPDSRRLMFGRFGFSVVDTADGSVTVIYRSPDQIRQPAISADGKRLAYVSGDYEWNVLEISIEDRRVHNMVSGGGAAWWPDWAPSGTHFLFSTDREGPFAIEDRSLQERFSRRLFEALNGRAADNPLWAPDGSRFVYWMGSQEGGKLMLSNASGGRSTTLDTGVVVGLAAWSPDGQWVAYGHQNGRNIELAKIRPGSSAAPVVIAGPRLRGRFPNRYPLMQWSPTGEWILYPPENGGLSLISPDGRTDRKLTPRLFWAYGFSKDGNHVQGIDRNTDPAAAEWQLYAVDVSSGAEKMIGAVDLPPATEGIAGFSLHPNGKSFLTSIAKWPDDIWMLEGFDQNRSWLDRLLRR